MTKINIFKHFTSVIAVIFFIFIAFGSDDTKKTSAGSTETSTNNGEKSEKESTPTYAKIGDQVEVENFAYRVDEINYKKTIGNEFVKETADGIFLIIGVTIKNTGKETKTLDNSMFKLTDDNGVEFESSSRGSTAIEMSGGKSLFLKQCNPQIQTSGILVFEVPDKKVYDLHLSGGFWSGKTAVVKLTQK